MKQSTKLIITVVESFACDSFKNQGVVIIFPYIVAILTFLILAPVHDITAVFPKI